MHASRPLRFVRALSELQTTHHAAKLLACPHCGRTGTLNAHGWLHGYHDLGPQTVIRGRRFFCSNRRRRPGCGRTFSVLIAHCIARYIVTTSTLLALLHAVLDLDLTPSAWAQRIGLARSSGPRLWQRLQRARARLRTALHRRGPPPPSDHPEPWRQILAHLRAVLPRAGCLFAEFQAELQRPLLSD